VLVDNWSKARIGVVIPAFNAASSIGNVLQEIPASVERVVVVIDACKNGTAEAIYNSNLVKDHRIKVLVNAKNLGVGGSTIRGMQFLLQNFELDTIVKIDADGQIDPTMIPALIKELYEKELDYVKGNRLDWEGAESTMPRARLYANNLATLFFKIATGYWNLGDPANGFIGIRTQILSRINLERIKKRWFFESDLLGALSITDARVGDFPMRPVYGNEKSNVNLALQIFPFTAGFTRILLKRIATQYFTKEMNLASLSLLFCLFNAVLLLVFSCTTIIPKVAIGNPITSGQAGLLVIAIMNVVYSLSYFFGYDFKKSQKQH
jgi:dolichol-phosphate mannosyltransferase